MFKVFMGVEWASYFSLVDFLPFVFFFLLHVHCGLLGSTSISLPESFLFLL